MSTLINSANSNSIGSRPKLLDGIGIKEMLKRYSIVRMKNAYYLQHSCYICFCFLENALGKNNTNIFIPVPNVVSIMHKNSWNTLVARKMPT